MASARRHAALLPTCGRATPVPGVERTVLPVLRMIAVVLNEADLLVELNRLIHVALDTRAKLLACSLQSGTRAIRALARRSAAALARAAHELADLVRRLGGRPLPLPRLRARHAPLPAPSARTPERALLADCERAVAEVACLYRDALEWSLPQDAQAVLMRQFCVVIDDYQRIKRLLDAEAGGAAAESAA